MQVGIWGCTCVCSFASWGMMEESAVRAARKQRGAACPRMGKTERKRGSLGVAAAVSIAAPGLGGGDGVQSGGIG